METTIENKTSTAWSDLAHTLGKDDTFVKENYALLKDHRFFAAIIPEELGGEGMSYAQMCDILRILSRYCSSTALALSMHQHLLAANIWKYKQGKGGEEILRKVANQQLILVSTGANDWLESNGKLVKTKDGYLFTGEKHFASQSPVGNVLITSGAYEDPETGWQVLHFPVQMKAEGVSLIDNWYTLGMRGTGSQTVKLESVFIPESSVVLRRPRGIYHLFYNVVLTVAMPLIMSVYVGIAEKAAHIATGVAMNKKDKTPSVKYLVGEMYNALTTAQVVSKDMISFCSEYNFAPEDHFGNNILMRKTIVAKACVETVNKAMEVAGGQSFYRYLELERLFRDVQGAAHHPLPEKEQQKFTSDFILKGSQA